MNLNFYYIANSCEFKFPLQYAGNYTKIPLLGGGVF
jgi:hypothetical protein